MEILVYLWMIVPIDKKIDVKLCQTRYELCDYTVMKSFKTKEACKPFEKLENNIQFVCEKGDID